MREDIFLEMAHFEEVEGEEQSPKNNLSLSHIELKIRHKVEEI